MKTSHNENEIQESRKPIVAMYYTYGDKIGGPLTNIHTIMESSLKEKYDFRTCYQNKAPGGLDIGLLKTMVKKLKEMKPDIVHVHGAQSEGFYGVLASKLAGCKHVILTVHGFAFDDSGCTGIKHFLYRKLVEPYELRHADGVYCVCEYASKRKIVVRNAKKRSMGYIHNCLPRLDVRTSREDVRSMLHVKDSDMLFATSGRITKDKGFDFLIRLVKEINQKQIKGFKLLVMGDGGFAPTFREELKEEISKGQVMMTGQTDDVATYLHASDAFIFPSYHENLSLSIVEAGASGLPVIASDVGGNREVIRDGVNGFVLDGHSVQQYLDKIIYFLENPNDLHRMQRETEKDIKERFSPEHMCEQIDSVYTHTLN